MDAGAETVTTGESGFCQSMEVATGGTEDTQVLGSWGALVEALAAGSCATALQISACSAPTFPTHHFLSWAHPLARRGRSQRGEVWLWRRDVKKTCTQPTGSPVQSDYSCWRPNARRHGLGERECLVLVGRDHCAATWMKGIFFIITKIRQAMKDTFFHQGRRRYPA